MVLNIPPKREPVAAEPAAVTEEPLNTTSEPTPTEEPRRRTRRTTATVAPAADGETPAPPVTRTRTTRTRKTAAEKAAEAEAQAAAEAEALAKAISESATEEIELAAEGDFPTPEPVTVESMPEPDSVVPEAHDAESGEASRGSRRRGNRGGRGRGRRGDRDERNGSDDAGVAEHETEAHEAPVREDANTRPELRPILRAIEQQSRQVERLAKVTEDLARRSNGSGGGAPAAAPAQVVRVGVFVDTANIELATDRLRVRFDWSKVLRLLLRDRQLVRAVAYSPIHDDPAVSIETQRFVEPFLDRGFKIVTKPFRRFQDGSIKANLDIELALDVVAMLDRLDVLVLVSGDGDFQRLVELAQSRGVRVEVAAVGASTAGNLRHAADQFTDLGARARDLRAGG